MTTQGQRFRRRALRRGYKVDEVDEFLDRAEATLAGETDDGVVGAQEVHDVVFKVRFGGYDEWQVDVYLDRLERQLTKLEEEGHPGGPRQPERPSRLSRAEESGYPPPNARGGRGYGGERGMPAEHGYGAEPDAGYGPDPGNAHDFPTERGGRGRGDGYGPREEPGYGQPLDEPTMLRRPDRSRPAAASPPRSTGGPMGGQQPPQEDPRMQGGPPMPDPQQMPRGVPPHAAAARPPHQPDANMTQQIPNMRAGSGGYEIPGRHGRPDMTSEIGAAGDSPFTPDDLTRLDQLRRTFQLRRFGSGYDRGQVDRLFDAIAATMAGRSAVTVTDGELDPGQFSLVQGGYFEAEIDA
ncbi:MAG: DivIVA domain-containing protein, partial [Micromonosporaceae bacterium]